MSDLERRLARLERAQASGGVVFRVMPPDLEGAPEARACWTEEQRAALPRGASLFIVNTGIPPRDTERTTPAADWPGSAATSPIYGARGGRWRK